MKTTYSSGGIVLNRKGQVLVVNQNNDSWSLPKGHIEKGETPIQAATREIEEESGIKELKLVRELGSYERYRIGLDGRDDLSDKKHITMFLFTTENTLLNPQDPHTPEARWLNKKDVSILLTHRKDKEFFEAWLNGQ